MIDIFKTHQGKGVPDFEHSPLEKLQSSTDYLVSPALQRAVNLSVFLGQPLLLTGEPGTGKTELARHLALSLSKDGSLSDFYVFNTKTTSTAQDLFYRYDSLRHFQYVNNQQDALLDAEIEERFITYQALGKAIKSGRRSIVLIDEIDKAPRDFPNDILDVMTQLSFEVPELDLVGEKRVKTDIAHRPIVIMTSNSEKALPDAFLRRCVFFHIEFPDDDMLQRILKTKVSYFSLAQAKTIVSHFQNIRESCKRKQPSTAEMLQWALVLEQLDGSGELPLENLNQPKSEKEKEALIASYSLLIKDKEDLKKITQKY